MYGIVLVVVLLIMGGAIAYIGDHLGSKIGKKRISIWGLRPKHTSILMTIVTGVLISLLTLGTMTVISNDVRTALFGMEKLNKKIATLNSDIKGKNQEIQQALTQLTEKNDDLKKLDEVIKNNKSKIDELTLAKQSVSQELDKAKETVATAQEQFEAAQRDLSTTQAAKDQLLQEINQFYYKMSLYELKLLNNDAFLQGISYHTLLYINVISLTTDCTVSKIAQCLNITKSAVTLKINELEKQGIIYKQQSEKDKRIFYVCLQEKAQNALDLYDQFFLKAEEKLKQQYSKEEINTFVNVLQSMAQLNLEAIDYE